MCTAERSNVQTSDNSKSLTHLTTCRHAAGTKQSTQKKPKTTVCEGHMELNRSIFCCSTTAAKLQCVVDSQEKLSGFSKHVMQLSKGTTEVLVPLPWTQEAVCSDLSMISLIQGPPVPSNKEALLIGQS